MAAKSAVRADQVEGCPPHHWLIDVRTQTCKKCGEERPLPVQEHNQWGRATTRQPSAPEAVVTPSPQPDREEE